MKKIGIIGCGWLGFRMADYFSGQFKIYTTTSSQAKADTLTKNGFNPTLVHFRDDMIMHELRQWELLPVLDIIIIAVPFSEKRPLKDKLQNLISFTGNFKGQLFFMSSTAVYPAFEKEYVETDVSPESVLGERMIREKYSQVNILRLAGLMGDERLLRNYNVTNLDIPVNHVHYADICAVVEKMIERASTAKLYNIVAPLHPAKYEVINTQNNIAYSEKATIKGKTISPATLMAELDFVFKFPDPRYFH